jgi:DNA-binding FrmR family transcriptional regulator
MADHVHLSAGYLDHKGDVLSRLRKVEGQVRGLQRMVDADTYCIDVLTQISATTKALESTALLLMQDHLNHCVSAEGGDVAEAKLKEAGDAIARLVRS